MARFAVKMSAIPLLFSPIRAPIPREIETSDKPVRPGLWRHRRAGLLPFRLLASGDPLPARPLCPAGQGQPQAGGLARLRLCHGAVSARTVVDPCQHDGVWRHSAARRLRAAGRPLRLSVPLSDPGLLGLRPLLWRSPLEPLAARLPGTLADGRLAAGLGDDRLSLALVWLHPDRRTAQGVRSHPRGAGHHARPAAHHLSPLAHLAEPQAGLAAAAGRAGRRRPGADAAQLGDPGRAGQGGPGAGQHSPVPQVGSRGPDPHGAHLSGSQPRESGRRHHHLAGIGDPGHREGDGHLSGEPGQGDEGERHRPAGGDHPLRSEAAALLQHSARHGGAGSGRQGVLSLRAQEPLLQVPPAAHRRVRAL
ncbi:hypothetical protein D3C75_386380 [compost metagenome]